MFTISEEAEQYIADLFKEQGEELGLKVEVEMAGTPRANVTFNFCRPDDMHSKYEKFSYKGLLFRSNVHWGVMGLRFCDYKWIKKDPINHL